MKLMARSIALAVVVLLLVSGPLGTFARAQQPAQQPAEQPAQPAAEPAPPPAQSAEQPAPQPAEQPAQAASPPAEPAQAAPEPAPQPPQQPAQMPVPQPAQMPAPQPAQMPEPQPAQQPEQMPQPARETVWLEQSSESTAWYALGATIANVVFIPGKAVTCALGLVVGSGLLVVTLGAGYKGAAAFAKEGCGGKWVLVANDLRGTDWILGSGDRPDRN